MIVLAILHELRMHQYHIGPKVNYGAAAGFPMSGVWYHIPHTFIFLAIVLIISDL